MVQLAQDPADEQVTDLIRVLTSGPHAVTQALRPWALSGSSSMVKWMPLASQMLAISRKQRALLPPEPLVAEPGGRNESVPCGSGKKYKKRCASEG